MLVERVDFTEESEKKKKFHTWIFCDQEWHREEPVGWLFPPYGVFEAPEDDALVLVVEGEKTADFYRAMLRSNLYVDASGNPFIASNEHPASGAERHPWTAEIQAEGISHVVTWRAGAAEYGPPWKTDWHLLNRPDLRFLIIPDNDDPSYEVTRIVRECLSRVSSIQRVNFNLGLHKSKKNHQYGVPEHWDICDPVPLLAPAVDERMGPEPLTRTRLKRTAQPFGNVVEIDFMTGMPRLKPKFANTIIYVESSEEYWFEDGHRGYKAAAFNKSFNHLVAGKSRYPLSMLAEWSPDKKTVRSTTFQPGGTIEPKTDSWVPAPRIVGESALNVYVPPPVVPKRPVDSSATRMLVALLRHVVPERVDRKLLIRGVSIVRTARTFQEMLMWAILAHSEHFGTGKTTVGRMLRLLFGEDNSSVWTHQTLAADKGVNYMVHYAQMNEVKDDVGGFRVLLDLLERLANGELRLRLMNQNEVDTVAMFLLFMCTNWLSAIHIPSEDERRLVLIGFTEDYFPVARALRRLVCMYLVGPYRGWEYPDRDKPVDQKRIQFNPAGGWMKFVGMVKDQETGKIRPSFAPLDPAAAGLSPAEMTAIEYIDQPKETTTETSLFFGAVMPTWRKHLPEITHLCQWYGRRLRRPMPGRAESWYEMHGTRAPMTRKKEEAIEASKTETTTGIEALVAELAPGEYVLGHDLNSKLVEDGGKPLRGRAFGAKIKAAGLELVAKEVRIFTDTITDKDGMEYYVPNSAIYWRPDSGTPLTLPGEIRTSGKLKIVSKEWIQRQKSWTANTSTVF